MNVMYVCMYVCMIAWRCMYDCVALYVCDWRSINYDQLSRLKVSGISLGL